MPHREVVRLIEARADAPALIVDVRGDGGGTTPMRLIRALMDRPWQWYAEGTPVSIGSIAAVAQLKKLESMKGADAGDLGSMEALAEFDGAKLVTRPPLTPPSSPIFLEPIFVLIDRECGSACEDFVMPVEQLGRAMLLGEEEIRPTIEDLRAGEDPALARALELARAAAQPARSH